MRKTLNPKAYLYPQPVLIVGTYDENGAPDAMNAAWGMVSDTTQVSLCLSASHKTVKNLLKTQAFTVSIADVNNVVACDFVGVVSANVEANKLAKTGWHVAKSACVNAPIFEELPLTLECKLLSYDTESEICVGEVVGVNADERILDENGRISVDKLQPICYATDTHEYYALGQKVGNAFADGKQLK